MRIFRKTGLVFSFLCCTLTAKEYAQDNTKLFHVIAFYTGREDLAHISFVHEANTWFPGIAKKYHFTYDSTNNWSLMNDSFLAKYQVVLLLDTRPDQPEQRAAFERYMKKGGGCIAFHFAGFALTPSAFPQNWNWYHDTLMGCGQYKSNTWRPTAAILRVEDHDHPVTKNLPDTFRSSPNEWYRWEKDIRKDPDIEVLLSIDATSFPLGTGPKPNEIWHSGDYPVVWTNRNYHLLYVNMGHNDMDYEGGTNATLSYQFKNKTQDQMIINAILWLGGEPFHK